MSKNANQSKQYRIYIKESKSWVDVNKEFYTNYYRDINSYRKRQQEHGRCVCPASKRYLCDMDCKWGSPVIPFKLFQKLRSDLKDYI